MASVDVNTYSGKEFRFAIKPEAAVGTKLTTSMQLLNITGDVSVSKEVAMDTSQHSGVGRTLKVADIHTTDEGRAKTTITVPIVLDTTVDSILLEAATWTATGTSPASVDIAYNYAPSPIAHGGAPGSANIGTFTLALISPIANKTRFFIGACLESIVVTGEMGTDGGRLNANLTFVTEYREADATTDPTGMSAYGSTFRYIHDFSAKKSVGGDDIILSKVEYSITNPATYNGFQGTYGDPEEVTRGVRGGRLDVGLSLSVKYDANTQPYWQDHRAGSIIAVEISNNATWASSTFGIKASYCKLASDVNPADTDNGAYQDIELIVAGSTSGDLIQIVP